MKRVYVNEEWCLGCHLCEYYCAFAGSGEKDMARALKGIAIRPNINIEEKDGVSFAVSCRHCDAPYCAKACITGALRALDGVISIDREKCIGCYTCIASCPYGCISPSETGTALKCELCAQTVDGVPMCVQGCPNRAIVFEERGEAV